jgi:hypothetical protein
MNDEQASHRLAARDAFDGEPGHRVHIVTQHDTLLSGGPSQDVRIVGFRPYRFHPYQIQPRPSAYGATHQIVVKILVRK